MSEEILRALTQLFAIIAQQDGGISEAEKSYVYNYFRSELDTKTVEQYIELFEAYYDDRVDKKTGKILPKLTLEELEKELEGYEKALEAVKKEPEEVTKPLKEKIKNLNRQVRQAKKAQKGGASRTSATSSVKVLKIATEINDTLVNKQKYVVFVRLLEMLAADRSFTEQRMEIIKTVGEKFHIPAEENNLIREFAIQQDISGLNQFENVLLFDEQKPAEGSKAKYIESGLLDGEIIFIRLQAPNMYFIKYTGNEEVVLNGLLVKSGRFLQFSPGSIIKTPRGAPLYYSDLVNRFNEGEDTSRISFEVNDLEFRFPNGHIGLRNINIQEGNGKLIGIMGASGAGKTTLLNTMAGLGEPYKGEILINGLNLYSDKDKLEGVIGYIAQDDLLIEELTVYQNLYYNAKLCFKDMKEDELHRRVIEVLESLGLDQRKDLKVGSVLDKTISGGQRKRLNIALELIREPAVMFVDEPTSGLSSRDSENVIDLLKELSLKGKLIFVVIHQPSSDIYKMFDKMFIMDTGGYPVFYGNPVEGVTYFKRAANQIKAEEGQCPNCGNVTPELLFNILEARVVDEFGETTNKRKVDPEEWHELYNSKTKIEPVERVSEAPPSSLSIPGKLKQAYIFTVRDFLSKIANQQYMSINLLEAPFLAFLLAGIIRYRETDGEGYLFSQNDNLPPFILISIIIALFMGLTVSAEEIISDRKIQKRESFLNLSRMSYLASKIFILFTLSAIQTLTFVLIGHFILGVQGLTLMYWGMLFTVSCHANLLGLNISSAFNKAVTVYIVIPLLLIPQMILSGGIFPFDKLNEYVSSKGKVPVIADFMASRWAYEAICVEQYRSNRYQAPLFDVEMKASQYNYKAAFWTDKMTGIITETRNLFEAMSEEGVEQAAVDSIQSDIDQNLLTLRNELKLDEFTLKQDDPEQIVALAAEQAAFLDNVPLLEEHLANGEAYYNNLAFDVYGAKRDEMIARRLQIYGAQEVPSYARLAKVEGEPTSALVEQVVNEMKAAGFTFDESIFGYDLATQRDFIRSMISKRGSEHVNRLKDEYHNEYLKDAVTNANVLDKVEVHDGRILQHYEPIYHVREDVAGPLDYRTHLYAPEKKVFGQRLSTFWFNVGFVWTMSALLFLSLYYELLAKALNAGGAVFGSVGRVFSGTLSGARGGLNTSIRTIAKSAPSAKKQGGKKRKGRQGKPVRKEQPVGA